MVAIALQDRSVAARICRLLIGILVTTATLGFSLCFKAVKDLFSRRCAVVVCTPCKQRKIGKDVRLAIHLTIVKKISMSERRNDYSPEAMQLYKVESSTIDSSGIAQETNRGKLTAIEIRDLTEFLPKENFHGVRAEFTHVQSNFIDGMIRDAERK